MIKGLFLHFNFRPLCSSLIYEQVNTNVIYKKVTFFRLYVPGTQRFIFWELPKYFVCPTTNVLREVALMIFFKFVFRLKVRGDYPTVFILGATEIFYPHHDVRVERISICTKKNYLFFDYVFERNSISKKVFCFQTKCTRGSSDGFPFGGYRNILFAPRRTV